MGDLVSYDDASAQCDLHSPMPQNRYEILTYQPQACAGGCSAWPCAEYQVARASVQMSRASRLMMMVRSLW